MADTDLRREDEIGERYDDMFNNHPDLVQMENDATKREFQSIAAENADLDARADKNAGVEEANRRENSINYVQPDSNDKKSNNILMRRRSPLMVLVGLLGAGLFGASFFGPAGALIHVAEIVKEKYDTMSSVVDARGTLVLKNRMFDTSVGCKIKIRCKYSGITQRQMDRLEANGAKLVDADGKPVSKNALGRYTGGKKLVLSDGTEITADKYRRSLRTSAELRTVSRSVFAPRWVSWNDEISTKIKQTRRLVQNPKWEEESKGDDKDVGTRKSISSAVGGEGAEISSTDPEIRYDDEGNPIDNPNDAIDFGEATDQINEEAASLSADAADGKPIDPIPTNTAEAAMMKESLTHSVKNRVMEVANPLGFLNGYCEAFQLSKALILASKTILLVQIMRYASQFMSTADKLKAGDASSTEVAAAMTILYRINKSGESFGDSNGYHYATYGKVSPAGIGSSASGNGVVRVLKEATIGWANKVPGGATTVNDTCKVLTNAWVGGALSLTSFIPGVGQAVKFATKLGSEAGESAAKKFIKETIEKEIKKYFEDGVASGLKDLSAKIAKMAAGPAGIFIASYLVARYAVPALARIVAGAALTGNEDGVTALDTIANGFEATNNQSALARGLQPLHKNELSAFIDYKEENDNQYATDMMAAANPFDTLDPYSFVSQVSARLYPQAIKAQSMNGAATIGSLGSVVSLLSPTKIFGGTSARAASADNGCDDDYLSEKKLATSPFCNVTFGFADTNMLQSKDPQAVADWMYDNNQVDDNGDPVAGSDFAEFKATCVDVGEKIISDSDIGDEARVPEECFAESEKWDSSKDAVKMYRLYLLDTSTDEGMDYVIKTETNQVEPFTFGVASYNMCHEGNHPGCPQKATKATLISNLIKGSGGSAFDVVGAQELSPDTQTDVLKLLPDYESFPKEVAKNRGLAIFWNTTKFQKQDQGYIENVYSNTGDLLNRAGTGNNAYPAGHPWVKLSGGGRSIYVITSHSPNNNYPNAEKAREYRRKNAEAYLKWAAPLATGDNLVVVTGDFNSSVTADGDSSTYCILTGTSILKHAYDIENGLNGACPTKNSTISIDQIYASMNIQGITATGWKHMNNSEVTGTDHSPAYTSITLPGLAISAASEELKIGTYNIRTFTLNNSDFGDPNTVYDEKDKARAVAAAESVKNQGVGVVAIQEARGDQLRDLVGAMGYESTDINGGGIDSESNIAWDPTRYKKVRDGSVVIPKDTSKNRKAGWVELESTATSRKFIVFSMHTATANDTLRKEAARVVLEEARKLSDGSEVPVFVAGDMNSNDSAAGRRGVYDVFKESKYLEDTRDMAKQKEGFNCDTENSPENGRQDCRETKGSHIDQVWVTKDSNAQVSLWKNVATGEALKISDHNLVYADVLLQGGGDVNVATFNILHSDGTPESSWGPRLQRSFDTLNSNQISVAGLQEVRPDQLGAIKNAKYGFGSKYDIWPKDTKQPDFSPNPVIWDKGRYNLVAGSEKRIPLYYGPANNLIDHMIQVRLKDTASGLEFYVLNTHDPAGSQGGNDMIRASANCAGKTNINYRECDAYRHVDYINQLSKQNIPIIFTGDFNSQYSLVRSGAGGNHTSRQDRDLLTYCILSKNTPLRNSWDVLKGNKTGCPSSASSYGNSIDHIYVSPGVGVSKYWYAKKGPSQNGSDHPTIMSQLKFGAGGSN